MRRTPKLHLLGAAILTLAACNALLGHDPGTLDESVGKGGAGGANAPVASSANVTTGSKASSATISASASSGGMSASSATSSGGAGAGSSSGMSASTTSSGGTGGALTSVSAAGSVTSGAGGSVACGAPATLTGVPWQKDVGPWGQGTESVAIDPCGNVFAATDVFGPSDAGANDTDILLAKYDPSGALLWSKSFGNSLKQHVTSIATDDAGGVYMTGSSAGLLTLNGCAMIGTGIATPQLFVARFDETGACTDARFFPAANTALGAQGKGIATAGNQVAIVGWTASDIDFGKGAHGALPGQTDAFVAVLHASAGTFDEDWSDVFGGAADDVAVGVAISGSTLVLAGSTTSSTVTVGSFTEPAPGVNAAMLKHDVFAAGLDLANGTALWAKVVGGPGDDQADGVATNGAYAFIVGKVASSADLGGSAFMTTGSSDAFALAVGLGNGAFAWARHLGAQGINESKGVAASAGKVFVAGHVSGAGGVVMDSTLATCAISGYDGFLDAFLLELDATGGCDSLRAYGTNYLQDATGVAVDSAGVPALTGSFVMNISFVAGQSMMATSSEDVFLAAVAP